MQDRLQIFQNQLYDLGPSNCRKQLLFFSFKEQRATKSKLKVILSALTVWILLFTEEMFTVMFSLADRYKYSKKEILR